MEPPRPAPGTPDCAARPRAGPTPPRTAQLRRLQDLRRALRTAPRTLNARAMPCVEQPCTGPAKRTPRPPARPRHPPDRSPSDAHAVLFFTEL
jgi:hypothetical protein